AYFGTKLLWAFWVGAVCYFFLLEATTRIYLHSELTPARMFKKMHKGLSLFLFFYVAFAAVASNSFQLAIFGLIGTAFGINYTIFAVAIGILGVIALLIGVYSKIERLFQYLMIFLIGSIISTAIAVGWPMAPKGIWISNIKPYISKEALPMIMAIVSTCISALFFLGYPYFMWEKGWTPSKYKNYADKVKVLSWARLDILLGATLGSILASPMTAIVAKIVYPLNIPMRSSIDMMMILEPLLGEWAMIVWALGLLVAGYTSSVGMLVLGSYICLDTFELDPRLGSKYSKILIIIIFAASIPLALLNINPVFLTLFVSAFRVLFYPICAAVILYAINSARFAGVFRNPLFGFGNLLGGVSVVVLFGLAITGVFQLIHTSF
ncbi:divalent metal cation transporter, partial [Candidatus Aerophobetes bacterium]|nr:divalent metal cation transporter [Candidatus Aerophobetes bacterium]